VLALVVTFGCEGHPPRRRVAPTASASTSVKGPVPLGETRPASVSGVTLDVPVDFESWKTAELERLEAGMRKVRPNATEVEVDARRSPSGGMMAVRLHYPVVVEQELQSVEALLQKELEAVGKALMGAAPAKARTSTTRDGGLELCVDDSSNRDGGAAVQSCLHISVDARRRATLLYTMCSEKTSGRCRSVLETRAYAPPKPLALDAPVPSMGKAELDAKKP